ncbi:hypothetical protein ScalyP_jg3933 [Parmales sp. scaly parma]|nr:hypothetical protein ScalyP_jg3933 [Parmales sp. scaly parma]
MIGLVVFARVTNNCVPIKIPSLNTHFTLFQPTNGYFNSFLSPGNKNGASCLALDDSASNSKTNFNSATISTKILSATNNNNLFEATNSVMAKRRFGENFPCSTLSLHKQRNSVNNKLKNENLAFAQKSLLQVSKISTLLRAEDDEVDAESNSYKVSFGTTNGGGTSMFNNKKGRLIITVANSQVTVSSPSQFISEQISQSVAKSINLELSHLASRANALKFHKSTKSYRQKFKNDRKARAAAAIEKLEALSDERKSKWGRNRNSSGSYTPSNTRQQSPNNC